MIPATGGSTRPYVSQETVPCPPGSLTVSLRSIQIFNNPPIVLLGLHRPKFTAAKGWLFFVPRQQSTRKTSVTFNGSGRIILYLEALFECNVAGGRARKQHKHNQLGQMIKEAKPRYPPQSSLLLIGSQSPSAMTMSKHALVVDPEVEVYSYSGRVVISSSSTHGALGSRHA